jgi:phosphoglycolate phosphatase-like HAD superfamily hydrolase
LTHAFEQLLGVPDGFAGVSAAGRTDPWIIAEAARHRGVVIDPNTFLQLRDAYLERLPREMHVPAPRKGVLPGVRPLLDTLSGREDVWLGLLTGNFEGGARIKLEYFDLWRYFRTGAFGDDVLARNDLFDAALARVRESGGPAFEPADVIVIGDTPLDVEVARVGGGRSVGVATGSYDVEALRDSGADVVLRDLEDLEAALTALGCK